MFQAGKINFTNNSTGTSVSTSPYQFTTVGINSLYVNNLNTGTPSPSVVISGTGQVNVSSVTVVSRKLSIVNGASQMDVLFNVTPTSDSTYSAFQCTLNGRTTTNTSVNDIYGQVTGINASQTPLYGMSLYADTTSERAVVSFWPNGTGTHRLSATFNFF